jgi:hypothetical protein
MSKPQKNIRAIFSGEEISLSEIWNLFWVRKKYVIILAAVFAVLGYIAAKTSPEEYQAKCVLLLTDKAGGAGAAANPLLGLAGFAGVQAPAADAGNDIGAAIYPIILNSKPFLIELSNDTFQLRNSNVKTTLKQYFKKGIKPNAIVRAKEFILGIPGMITGLFKSKPTPAPPAPLPSAADKKFSNDIGTTLSSNVRIIELTSEDQSAAGILGGRITFMQTGSQLTLTVKMPEAWLSAQATQMVLDKLILYVTKYKTGKQLDNLNFLEARTNEAEAAYKGNQQKVAGFQDNNYGVVYKSIQSREQLLQNEFTLAFGLYNSLATQLQQARIQLKKDTPIFSLLEPVYVPGGPSEPVASKIIITYVFIGIFIGIAIVFLQLAMLFFKKEEEFPEVV